MKMKQKTVLITGATGFLGSYITRGLFESGFHLKLLVRKTAPSQAEERFFEICTPFGIAESVFNFSRNPVEIIEGDISKSYFGLNTADYLKLAETVDEVFHCAAATKFDNNMSDIHTQTNIVGTDLIALFCMTRKLKRLHHISTAYVAGKRRDTVLENELERGQLFNNNYERSKYEAERNLSLFVKRHQIPCTIYRPSIITGDATTGYTKNYDNIYVFGKGLSRLKNHKIQNIYRDKRLINVSRPTSLRIPGDKYGTINLIPVDYAARSIIAISRRTESINNTFHIVNPSPPTLGELAEWMKLETGIHYIKIVPMREFETLPHTLQERLFLQGTEAFQFYMFGEPYFDSTNAKQLLRGTGIECPLITQEFIHRFIQYGVDTRWGKKNTTSGKEARFLKIQEPFLSVRD